MADKAQSRADRLKAALRENLKRRKAQKRGRNEPRDRSSEGSSGWRDPGDERKD